MNLHRSLTKLVAGPLLALGLTAGAVAAGAGPASANQRATTAGASVSATGWYYRGLHSAGTVTDTAADGHCAYAEVKLALRGYNDYTFNKARVCGAGSSRSWDHSGIFADVGPILSSFSASAIQGVYVRACVDNRTWPLPDTCGSWVYVGGYGRSSGR